MNTSFVYLNSNRNRFSSIAQLPNGTSLDTEGATKLKTNIEELYAAGKEKWDKIKSQEAYKKYKDFDLEDAIMDFKKGLELSPTDVALHFNLACAYSLTEKKYLSYHHLSLAVGNGLKDVEKIMSHDDLAFVRIQPEFSEFKGNGFRINPFKSDKVPSGQEGTQPDEEKDESLLSQLNHLAELKSRGLLSDIEFNTERKKILKQ